MVNFIEILRSSRDSNRAETPRLSRAIHHAARNHLRNGVRVRWKIVPAVTDS